MSTVTLLTVPSGLMASSSTLMPDAVSRRTRVWSVRPRSYTYLPMQRLALPHISPSEPSALKMRMVKSASGVSARPMSTRPSLPMPMWERLQAMDAAWGSGMAHCAVSTKI